MAAVALVEGSDAAAAADLVQEALARVWERADKGEEIESLSIWVTRAALKPSRWRHRFGGGKSTPRARPANDESSELEAALATLSRLQRQTVVLLYYLGLDTSEIAESIGVRRGRARASLNRARLAIAAALEEREGSDETTSDLDPLLREHLERLAHPGVIEPSMFQAIDLRRAKRSKMRRLQSAGAALAVLAAAVGAFTILGNPDGNVPPTPSAMPPDTSAIVAVSHAAVRYSSLWAGPQQLTPTGSHDQEPAVDPAGRLVAFVRTSPGGDIRPGLYTVPFAGVPAGPCPTCGFKATRLLGRSWFASDPAWSPDGTKIAFAGGELGMATGIYVVSATGGAPHLIYASSNGSAMQPSWSPDGSQISFAEATGPMIGSSNFDLYVVRVELSSYRPPAVDITRGNSRSEIAPAWSPDGKVIAFSMQTTTLAYLQDTSLTTGVIATVSPDGSHLRVLTPAKASDDFDLDSDPAWSPDGRFLAFDRSGSNSGVYYVSSAGGSPAFVRPGSDPSWRPTGATGLPTEPPVGIVRIPGLSFPACDVSSIHGRFLWHQSGEIAYLLVQAGAVPCTAGAPAHQFIALTVHGHGPFPSTVLSGPISDCQPACRVFAAPFLDNGPVAQLAVMLTQRGGAVLIELFKADSDGVFNSVLDRSGAPYLFNWGMRGIYRAGVSCSPPDSPQTLRRLDFWTAVNQSGAWHLNETFATLRGTTMIVTGQRESVLSSASALPAGGGNDFCGAPVRP